MIDKLTGLLLVVLVLIGSLVLITHFGPLWVDKLLMKQEAPRPSVGAGGRSG
jgi:hypothetical protein